MLTGGRSICSRLGVPKSTYGIKKKKSTFAAVTKTVSIIVGVNQIMRLRNNSNSTFGIKTSIIR